MRYARIVLIMILAIFSVSVSADKKKKVWRTDSAYLAQRYATIQAMDSVLKNVSGTDALMRFADMKCKEFDDDPKLMRPIASLFATRAGLIDLAVKRYQEIKKCYPNDFESYSDYAATLFDYSIKVNPNTSLNWERRAWFDLAKAQIDSAKVALPDTISPYLWWIARCTQYAYNDSMQFFIKHEVEELQRKFPNKNADYLAARIIGNTKDYQLKMDDFEHIEIDNGDEKVDKWRFQAQDKRSELAQNYYDKADINNLSDYQLATIANYYYESTETKNMYNYTRAKLYEKGLQRAALGMKKFPNYNDFKYLQIWNAAELSRYHYKVANSDSVKKMGEERRWDELDLCNNYATQALQAYESLNIQADSIDYKTVLYAAMSKQYSGKYEDAMQLYRQGLNNMQYVKQKDRAPLYKSQYHDLDSLTAFQNMIACYKSLDNYEQAIDLLNMFYDLRKQHGYQLVGNDLLALAALYVPIGNDETRTQKERFDAFVAIDSLYGEFQDSIDVENKDYMLKDGYTGYYTLQRMQIRKTMNGLEDYKNRENYLATEMADDVIRRIESVEMKSNDEKKYLYIAIEYQWYNYYQKENYEEAIKYLTIGIKLIPDYPVEITVKDKKGNKTKKKTILKEQYQNNIKSLQKQVGRR